MATLEERVAYLEGQMADQVHIFAAIRDSIAGLDRRIDRFEQHMEARFDAVDRRFDAVDRRFVAVDRRFEGMDHRFEGMDHRFAGIEDKMSRQFLWVVGIQITTLMTVMAVVLSRG